MIKSMTGFGRSEFLSDDLNIIVEIKTLNSKNLDFLMKIPKIFSEKEIEIRNILEKRLERGKIIFSIEYQNKDVNNQQQVINEQLFKAYYLKLQDMADELSAEKSELFRLAMYLPEVISPEIANGIDPEKWTLVLDKINEAIILCDDFRIQEGRILSKEFIKYITSIEQYLNEVDTLDPDRIEQIRTRIHKNLSELIPEQEYDKNRFEQELIYYLEKLDISEEKVRLKSHLDYFLSELELAESNGKKLNFIAQEIGREINTIGAKANFVHMTRYVILMKDSLEKIKEQLLNIL
ncbi:MAG: YicC family protein [Cyclobacteriaceae bacterium]|nr:YicC family protein [Cyclobacteriaceae bacterium]